MNTTLFAAVAVAMLMVTSGAWADSGKANHDADDDSYYDGGARRDCYSLSGDRVGGAVLGQATLVAATATSRGYCKVPGTIAPQLNFEVRLPLRWNKKLHYSGGGGLNGSIPAANLDAIGAGYVDVASDSGHQSAILDGAFALTDTVAASLFGNLSIPTVMATAKQIVKTYYDREPSRSYFEGCSNGGREALMMAQRFPLLFDGIVAGDPINNWTAAFGAFNRTAKALAAPGGSFTAGKIATLSHAVLAKCDSLDNLNDGIVSNPQACRTAFDFRTLRCSGGADLGDSCLSDPQLAVLKSLTEDAAFDAGNYRNVGWPLTGNEGDPGAWPAFVTNPAAGPNGYASSATFLVQDQGVKYWLAKDPTINSLTYDWNSNIPALFGTAALNDATNVDLRPFEQAGGKLILWHGGNSYAVSPRNTADYYEQVIARVGSQSAADRFVTFYLTAGTDHCGGGPGALPRAGDLLSAVDAWVTKGVSPGTRVAAHVDQSGVTAFTRPMCAYPKYPRYRGSGDPNLAASFTCVRP